MDLAPEEANGPYFWKILKSGEIRYVENPPKVKHIIEYVENIGFYGQDKMHYFNLAIPLDGGYHRIVYQCDYISLCGYDRGPRFNMILKHMWEKK